LRAYRLAERFRARGVPVVLGGYHVTLVPDEAQRFADAIVIGDADGVWQHVVNDAARQRLQPVYQGAPRASLTGLQPRREIFAGKRYQNLRLVEFARGCNFRCDFCSITAFHGARQSHRPPEDVVAEMQQAGGRRFFIVDDNFVSQPDQARRLCRALIPLRVSWVGQASIHIAQDAELLRLMAESGCRGVLIGMESLNEENLRQMGKQWNTASGSYAESLRRFRDAGLAVYGTFVFGYDHDTMETVQRSVEFACQQQLFLAAFNHLVPFPGTPLYRRLQAEGRLLKPSWWLDSESRVGDVVFRPARMTPEQLQRACLDARHSFFRSHAILRRMCDFRANCRNAIMAALFLGLNLQGKFDIDLRQGLQLGAGCDEEPVWFPAKAQRAQRCPDGDYSTSSAPSVPLRETHSTIES
jgi:radical SAM superfamily enzyme YgiQ (UPF0313 family)